MKDREILEKVIKKAIENGYEELEKLKLVPMTIEQYVKIIIEEPDVLIFNHKFAKAFWIPHKDKDCSGKEYNRKIGYETWENRFHTDEQYYDVNEEGELELYEWHLQQLVISEDRLQYLKQCI